MLPEALALCLVIFLMILFIFFYVCNRTFFGAFAGACLIALVVLIVAYPPFLLIAEEASWKTILYCVLIFIFIFILLIYLIVAIIKDRRNCGCPTSTCAETRTQTCTDVEGGYVSQEVEMQFQPTILDPVLTPVDGTQTEIWYEVPN